MRNYAYATLVAAIICMSSASNVQLEPNIEKNLSFFSLMEEKMEETTAMLEDMIQNFVSMPQNQDVPVLILDIDSDISSLDTVLTEEEEKRACDVALKQLAHERALTKEANSMHGRLRSHLRPMFHLFSTSSVRSETCKKLEQESLRNECCRILSMDKKITLWLQQDKSNDEICTLVQPTANPLSCKLCKRFVEMVNKAIEQDMTQVEQVREIIGDLCDSMAADSMCHTFIKRYDDIVAWLKSGTEPATVCLKIHMCLEETAVVADETHLVETSDITGWDDAHACFYCVNINKIIGYILHKSPNQEKTVHEVVHYGCSLVPQNCKCSVLDENYDKIVAWLKDGKEPHAICENLQMCQKPSSNTMEMITSSQASPTDVDGCFYCDYLSTILEIFIQEDTKDMELIRQYANMICDLLGESNSCHQYITQMDFVVDELKKNKKPREICATLKYCNGRKGDLAAITMGNAPVVTVMPVTVTDDSHQCFYCLHIVKVIRFVVQKSPEQLPKVREVIKYGCNLAPKECKCGLLEQNFDQIVNSLKNHERPFKICESIGSCKADVQSLSTEMVVKSVDENDDKTCLYCEVFTTLMEVANQQDHAEMEEIRQFADMVCGMLGDQSVCHRFVDKFDLVVDALMKGESSRKICAELTFCPVKHEQVSTAIGRSRSTANLFLVANEKQVAQDDGNLMEVQ